MNAYIYINNHFNNSFCYRTDKELYIGIKTGKKVKRSIKRLLKKFKIKIKFKDLTIMYM